MPEAMEYKRLRIVKRDGREAELFNVYGVVVKVDYQRTRDAVGRSQDEYRLILNDGETMHTTIYTVPDHIPAGKIAVGKVVRFHRLKLAIFNVPTLSGQKYLRGRIGGITSILVFDRPDDAGPSYVYPMNYTWEAVDKTILRQITRVYPALLRQVDNAEDPGVVDVQPIAGPSGSNPQQGPTSSAVPPPAMPMQPNALAAEPDDEVPADDDANGFDLDQLTKDMEAYRFRNIQKNGGVRGYYDFVCEIAGIYYTRDVAYLACFDGTRPSMRLRTNLPDLVARDVNEDLVRRATVAGFLVYVCLYDNNMGAADDLMPGDIVWIVNAHVYFMKAIDGYAVVMHKYCPQDNPFNRQVTKMDVNSVQYRAARTVFNAAKAKLPPVVIPPAVPATNAVTGTPAAAVVPRLNAFTPPRTATALTPSTATMVPGGSAVASSARRRLVPEAEVQVEVEVQQVQQQAPPEPTEPPHAAGTVPADDDLADFPTLDNEYFRNNPIPATLRAATSTLSTSSSTSANPEPPSSTTAEKTPKRPLARRPRSPFRGAPIVDSQMVPATSNVPASPAEGAVPSPRTRNSSSPTSEPIAKRTRNASTSTPAAEPIAKRTRNSANSSPMTATVSTLGSSKKKKPITPKKILTLNDLEDVRLYGSQSQSQ
uniref:POT1PC domain-containing protein n=1 Tax=Panagrellus redivivus TaxID=6233 RepID=A0A7E4W804_PANRE